MKTKLKSSSRVLITLFSLSLLAVIFLPIWKIELSAPQYPEGLELKIFADRLGGDVEVINGLNHYIGMQTLHTEDFIEFRLLPYLIGIFSFLGLVTALINRKWALYTYLVLFLLFSVVSMLDFYLWNYNYGHNLDPNAPIQVPGMSYQPPLIGYKQLLNFGAFSIPDQGGWIFVAVGVGTFLTALIEFRRRGGALRVSGGKVARVSVLSLLSAALLSAGCSRKPQPIVAGEDDCHFCKMTITDIRFGGELITGKGKVFKFDDVKCLASFTANEMKSGGKDFDIYVQDYVNRDLAPLSGAVLLRHPSFRSPMASGIAAFRQGTRVAEPPGGEPAERVTWDDLIK